MKRKIAFWFCLFLTVAPFLGSFIPNEVIGDYIGIFIPYSHLTTLSVGGMPFADGIGALFALMISVFGVLGFVVFALTKFRNSTGLKALLAGTIIYCGLRVLGGIFSASFLLHDIDFKTKLLVFIAILSNFAWGTTCYWAAKNIDRPRHDIHVKNLPTI